VLCEQQLHLWLEFVGIGDRRWMLQDATRTLAALKDAQRRSTVGARDELSSILTLGVVPREARPQPHGAQFVLFRPTPTTDPRQVT
jgi:hypothetical protein